MDVHIGELSAEVRAVDDRTLVSPEVLDAVVAEVLRRLDARRSTEEAHREERSLWASVRESGR
ncbi:hypothetical protein [Microbacterium sp. SSM24]|uniref:hypothetical protein n=1 Tax=Microbacterium sp. SSM24 TaxID=2991714 RepID=UPI0022269B70|nr:hypothetical protein [Microbacterium sp. SSM24]MCW3494212.1 hypothetical protein [Microbacterium sp. SSM24]